MNRYKKELEQSLKESPLATKDGLVIMTNRQAKLIAKISNLKSKKRRHIKKRVKKVINKLLKGLLNG